MLKTESTRVAFNDSLMELAEKDANIVLISSDSIKVVRADAFAEKYPERFIEVGIAEQNAVACAAGIASCGLIPFVATYAGFISMRACEQVRTYVAYPGLNVKFIGANGGIACGEREGVTHQFFEDIGIMRTIPGIMVVVPADAAGVREAVKAVAHRDGPAYIRIGSGRDPVLDTNIPFEFGKVRILKELGKDIAIFVNGYLTNKVLQVADILNKNGIGATVVEVHTLKPLDAESIAMILRKTGAAVTVEDHNIIGGLGSAISEVIAEEVLVPLVRVGLKDTYPESGEAEELLKSYGMGVEDIVVAAEKALSRKAR